jgi:hypothetical protein
MRQTSLALWSVLLTAYLYAQPPSADKIERAAIQRAKNLLVSSVDRSLPKVSLEFFLKSEGGGAPIKWEVNDCGEQTGNLAADEGRDFPMCVQADMDVKDGDAVTILVTVGTFNRRLVGTPALFRAAITDRSGLVRPVRRLSDLPMELHRPRPKQPRDLPTPVGAL